MGSGAVTLGRRTIWAPSLLAYLACTLLVARSSSYHQGLVAVAAAYAILALSLDLVAGATGLYSFGHAGLFAIGAYGTAILADQYHWSPLAALPLVFVAGAFVGLLIGALSLRVSGLYFAITTFIFAIVVTVLVSNLAITGGYQGLQSPTFPTFSGSLTSMLGSSLTWAISGCLLFTIVVMWSIRSSAMYPVLLSIRDSERFASSVGVRTSLTKVVLFGWSAAIAALGGWAFCFLGFITPSQFNATASINVFVMVMVGGMNTRVGPIIGAAFIGLFPVVVSINSLWQEIIYASIFIVVIIFFPEGFVGALSRGARRLWSIWGGGQDEDRPKQAISGPSTLGERKGAFDAAPASPDGDGSRMALEARGVGFSYTGGVRALDGVTLALRRGTIHGLIGPNGSGKSTLVDIISGVLSPDEGEIWINGQRADRVPPWRRVDLGLMRTFQTAAMVEALSTRDNVTLGLFNRFPHLGLRSPAWPFIPSARRDSRRMASLAMDALNAVGVGPSWAGTKVANVPHGVEQLTQLAAASAGQPSVLLLDEPLAGLSSDEIAQVESILRDLASSSVTVLVIEHQARFIFEVCDDVTVLAAGRVVKSGPAGEVRVDTQVREVYLGT